MMDVCPKLLETRCDSEMWANFNTYLKGIQMALVGNQVSDLVRFTVLPIWGWPGNIIKMGTYCNCVLCRSIPKQKRTIIRGKEISYIV